MTLIMNEIIVIANNYKRDTIIFLYRKLNLLNRMSNLRISEIYFNISVYIIRQLGNKTRRDKSLIDNLLCF